MAAVLNKYYSFKNPFGLEWTIWYLRESYTAILCANLPLIYPLIQRMFRLRNWSSHSGSIDGRYQQDSQRAMCQDPKLPPAHTKSKGTVRRTDDLDLMGNEYYSSRDDGPHFITSAIDLEDLRSPATPGVRSSVASSATSADWRPGENNVPGADPYHAK